MCAWLMATSGGRPVTLAEGEISELHVGLKGTMNALFLTDLANKTRRGLRGRVEAGRSGGGLTYGYDVVRTPRADGTVEVGGRRINEAQAEIVRRVFRQYVAGQSPRAIALSLNRDGIAGPRGRGWGASTINGNASRGTGILNNRVYIGKLVWNKLRYVKDPDTRKRRSKANKAEAVIEKDVPHLQIIEQDLWNAVKQRQTEVKLGPQNTTTRPWDRRRPRYLLSGLIKCGACDGGYVPAKSTVHAVLHRHGLVAPPGRPRHRATGTPLSRGSAPNQLWCADFKGEFKLGNGRYCYPLTVTA
jgi:site-specific DNA recombinase